MEIHALGAVQVAHPERGQVAQIAKAAPGRESHDFELVFEEIGAGGDLKWAAVILGAADDDQGSIEFLTAADNAEMLEVIAKNLASAFPPIGQHADARFQIEVKRINDHAVGSGAADA